MAVLAPLIPVISALSAGVGVYSAVQQVRQGKKVAAAGRDQAAEVRKQNEIVRKQNEIKAGRARRERVRAFFLARGRQENVAANLGVQGASGPAGAAGATASQFASSEGTAGALQAGQAAIAESQKREAGLIQRGNAAQLAAQRAGQVGQVAGNIFSFAGGPESAGKLFASDPKNPTGSHGDENLF